MKLKKLLALLLALIMVFALAACGDDVSNDDDDDDDDDEKESTSMSSDPTGTSDVPGDVGGDEKPQGSVPTIDNDNPLGPVAPEVSIVGKWSTAMKVDAETMGLEGLDASYFLYINLTFDQDGDYLMDVDEDATEKSMNTGVKDALVEYMVNELYAQFGGEAEAEAACQTENGMSCREYATKYAEEMIPMLKGLLAELVFLGKYELKDGKLFMDDEEMTFSLEGEKLELSREGWTIGGMGMGERVFLLVDAAAGDINPEDYESKEDLLPVNEAIVGTWEWLVAIDGEDMNMEDFEGLLFFDFTFTFNADGTYAVTIDKDALIESVKELESELVQYSVDLFFAQMETQGMSREEAAAAAQEYYGMTIQEYFQQEVAKQNMAETMSAKVEQMNGTGTYKVDGNMLTMDGAEGEPTLYTVNLMSNDILSMTSDNADFAAMLAFFGEESVVLFREGTE